VLLGVVPRQDGEVTPVALDLGVVVLKLVLGDAVTLEDQAEADQIPDVLQLGFDLILLAPLVEARSVGADVNCHVLNSFSVLRQSLSARFEDLLWRD
jgi:hypothetical protein